MISEYFRKIGARRFVLMIVGNIILSLGISIFKLSRMGNDPFSGMVMISSDLAGLSYANFLVIVNLVLLAVEFLGNRKLIGIGTLFNALLNGYIVTFFYEAELALFGIPEFLWQQLLIACLGVVVCGLGASLYQTPDVGTAPYDSLSLIMADRWKKIPYFWHRICTDGVCALICGLLGGIVGPGTLLCALGLGPFIHFFNVHVSQPLLNRDK